ncbi:hypothetical protein Pmani_030981 [Petrolisthes manimaculis]|uniref:GH18 domain-containing protein n=1 Tax=Petrolisthes manimaculis TaxID=1843537 RepID=A0AAE1TSY3_9EUCA|nr:hypothetical protein Pmani_030981 [Petrolisthes manimaculis]
MWWITTSTTALVLLVTLQGGFSDCLSDLDIVMKVMLSNRSPCPCQDDLLCMSLGEARLRNASAPHVQEYIRKMQKKEVFAFVLKCDPSVWMKFNWSKLTTIAIVNFYDSDLLCHAHQNGVRVVKLGNFPTSQLPDAAARQKWVQLQVSDATLKFLDGINLDFESAIDPYTPEERGLTSLVKETADTFHNTLPGSQVSFDVAWSAKGVDGRFYDYQGIANYSDLIFIMAYDEQSQIMTGPCTARPNSGIYMTAHGLQTYLSLGIPTDKMVLGVPWYGYNYPCIAMDKDKVTCYIKEVPFRGVNCSDAAGKEYALSWLNSNRHSHNASYRVDYNSLTPFYNYVDESGQIRQIRYDDPSSLAYKYMLAITTGLKGVGMWTANFLDYSGTDPQATMTCHIMWDLLP